MREIWKEVPNHKGYKVSTWGRVKNVSTNRTLSEYVNKNGYLEVTLNYKNYLVHQLVAIIFLNHKPNGNTLVVNHKNFNKRDNALFNLEVITNRENSSHLQKKKLSKYTGVYPTKNKKRWYSKIQINGKNLYLGVFDTEIDAHNAYQETLKKELS